MKRISYPEPQEIQGKVYALPEAVDEFILVHAFWRTRAHVSFGLSISKKLHERRPLTDREAELLEKGFELPGAQIARPLNLFLLACLNALCTAQDTDSEEPVKT